MLNEEEIEKAKGWLASTDTHSEGDEISKEIMWQYIKQIENENKEILQENTTMKDLLNVQARIAEILQIPKNEKMVKFGIGYYIPINMTLNKKIDKNETLTLEYISATSLLKYRVDRGE